MKIKSITVIRTGFFTLLLGLNGCAAQSVGSVQFPQIGNETASEDSIVKPEETQRYKLEPIRKGDYPQPEKAKVNSRGSIFANSSFRSLYEDQSAKFVGDLLVIDIQEKLQSKQTVNSTVTKNDSASIETPSIKPIKGFKIPGISGTASSSKSFDGGGSTNADNQMIGQITATVLEVLPNGYLRVMGEKQIGTNRQVEVLRIYGVVNPRNIKSGNKVFSSQIADARIEYVGNGQIDQATQMGWLSKFFLSYLPF